MCVCPFRRSSFLCRQQTDDRGLAQGEIKDQAGNSRHSGDPGTFELKLNDAQGNATTTPGKYVVAWRKQPTHDWKAVADIFNTDK